MRLIIILLLQIPIYINAQYSVGYQYKCRYEDKILRKDCESLSLRKDSTYQHLFLKGTVYLVEEGTYYSIGDTLIMVSSEIDFVNSISRRKGNRDVICLYYENYYENPVFPDSTIIYDNGMKTYKFSKASKAEFPRGDSIHYYLKGKEYYAPIKYGNKQLKSIVIYLPVDYFIIKDDSKIIGKYSDKVFKKNDL